MDQEHSEDEEESERSENEEDVQVANIQVSEQNFQFEDFIKKYVNSLSYYIMFLCIVFISRNLLIKMFLKSQTFFYGAQRRAFFNTMARGT